MQSKLRYDNQRPGAETPLSSVLLAVLLTVVFSLLPGCTINHTLQQSQNIKQQTGLAADTQIQRMRELRFSSSSRVVVDFKLPSDTFSLYQPLFELAAMQACNRHFSRCYLAGNLNHAEMASERALLYVQLSLQQFSLVPPKLKKDKEGNTYEVPQGSPHPLEQWVALLAVEGGQSAAVIEKLTITSQQPRWGKPQQVSSMFNDALNKAFMAIAG